MKAYHRHTIRLEGYDYSQSGMYFITICVHNRLNLFGKVINNVISLNDAGKMIDLHWIKLIDRFPHIELDDFVIMPNHLHGIITIVGVPLVGTQNNNIQHEQLHKGQPQGIAPTTTKKTVGEMIGAFKSITTNEYISNVKCDNWKPFNNKLWQRNYYEHIIRNEKSYTRISEYIQTNPVTWMNDKYFGCYLK